MPPAPSEPGLPEAPRPAPRAAGPFEPGAAGAAPGGPGSEGRGATDRAAADRGTAGPASPGPAPLPPRPFGSAPGSAPGSASGSASGSARVRRRRARLGRGADAPGRGAPPGRAPLRPWIVLLVAIVLPGCGQVLNHQPTRGLVFLFFMGLLGALTLATAGPEVSTIGRFAGAIFVQAMAIFDAYRAARLRRAIWLWDQRAR